MGQMKVLSPQSSQSRSFGISGAAASNFESCHAPYVSPEPATFQLFRPFAARPAITAAAELGLENARLSVNTDALPLADFDIAPFASNSFFNWT